jgi:hypothetical protein
MDKAQTAAYGTEEVRKFFPEDPDVYAKVI